ncbi:MAG: FAD-dependent oxidoreductase [Acidimicrobiia bacterium]|nr:FAD-dependent oxidoreductase [Acidimicrobiia bacterium]
MSDRFHPISMEQLTDWVFDELEAKDALFGVPQSALFVPSPDDRFRTEAYGVELDTPFGVAAGPHTQMAQNIIVSWAVGARVLELKTIQTLDELDIPKPCIDVEDEGYNVEWSQELKVYESFDEYLRAWVLIHALHHKFGWHGEQPGMLFNMSVGYNFEGILKPNVQWFLDTMDDASAYLPAYVDIVANRYPEVRNIDIPSRLSDNITLSTMHGCPPDEIERICLYLMEERGLHTSVKCNPTLLGADRVRAILNRDLSFADVPVPDEAFGHDLMYVDAVPMLHNLRRVAANHDLTFGVKLSNTLEVENWRDVFTGDEMMYLSGRPLHALTTNLASRLSEEYRGDLVMSFAGGADCFNVAELIGCGMKTITVCSDLLKSGGYLRMLQYMENLDAAMDQVGAVDIDDFIIKSAIAQPNFDEFAMSLRSAAIGDSGLDLRQDLCHALQEALRADMGDCAAGLVIADWAAGAGFDAERAEVIVQLALKTLARVNLRQHTDHVRSDWRYHKHSFRTDRSKTQRELRYFDCIEAPCVDECPIDQKVPQYMKAVHDGDFARAVELTRADNPLPTILGRVCDHLCEDTCIRTHLDQPLAIRHMKRFIMSQESQPVVLSRKRASPGKVAIIGAGPAGTAAALELGRAGFRVTIFEAHPYSGGMVGGAIPTYRLPRSDIQQDMATLEGLGVDVRYSQKAGVDFTIDDLRAEGYVAVIVAVGAQLANRLDLPGDDAEGVIAGIDFLRSVRAGDPMPIGDKVGVIGAGDTAMDCVRSALRVGAREVNLIYRRTVDQMPADPEEIQASVDEGINIVELATPAGLEVEDGRLAALVCSRTEYRGERDASGRNIPFVVPDSEFEISLDTLILAISQESVLDFFGDQVPQLTSRGYIDVDPATFESSISGVYAAGDVAASGPSSVVKAVADGKRVAAAVIATHSPTEPTPTEPTPVADESTSIDVHDLIVRRARREYRTPIRVSSLDERDGFEETVLGYTSEEAMAEASRCLDCDDICSLCVGVCPNMALMTYEMSPVEVDLPALQLSDGTIRAGERTRFSANQGLQIAVLTDLCNECGNCETACPTSGSPYRDKPRLYLDREDFEAQTANAFMMSGDSVIEARIDGQTHRVEVNGHVGYESPSVRATLHPDSLELIKATPGATAPDGQSPSLEPAAVMVTLLRGIEGSMAHLPVHSDTGTRVAHPGYAEG